VSPLGLGGPGISARTIRPGSSQNQSFFSFRQPPARLLAMICRNISARALSFRASPSRTATVRAVLLS